MSFSKSSIFLILISFLFFTCFAGGELGNGVGVKYVDKLYNYSIFLPPKWHTSLGINRNFKKYDRNEKFSVRRERLINKFQLSYLEDQYKFLSKNKWKKMNERNSSHGFYQFNSKVKLGLWVYIINEKDILILHYKNDTCPKNINCRPSSDFINILKNLRID